MKSLSFSAALAAFSLAALMTAGAIRASEGMANVDLGNLFVAGGSNPASALADGFLRFENSDLDVQISPNVSVEPLETNVIRKVGYGHESVVTVVRTPTGIYSSDAIGSPHVQYYGLSVLNRGDASAPAAQIWVSGQGWVEQSLQNTGTVLVLDAPSVLVLSAPETPMHSYGCAMQNGVTVCR